MAATIAYNVVEAIVAITAGTLASSTALVGFGLDSVIEVSSAAAVAWQFSARDHAARKAREKLTLRIISVCFFALAAYVTVDALTGTGEAERSVDAAAPADATAATDRPHPLAEPPVHAGAHLLSVGGRLTRARRGSFSPVPQA